MTLELQHWDSAAGGSAYALGAQTMHTLTILNDEPAPQPTAPADSPRAGPQRSGTHQGQRRGAVDRGRAGGLARLRRGVPGPRPSPVGQRSRHPVGLQPERQLAPAQGPAAGPAPTPTSPMAVSLTVSQSGDYAASDTTGTRSITIPASGSVTHSVATVNDAADEAYGSVTVTVNGGDGYTVGVAPRAHIPLAERGGGHDSRCSCPSVSPRNPWNLWEVRLEANRTRPLSAVAQDDQDA